MFSPLTMGDWQADLLQSSNQVNRDVNVPARGFGVRTRLVCGFLKAIARPDGPNAPPSRPPVVWALAV
jgi:hypothetical protein